MKFKVGDSVIVTSGKNKGKKSTIVAVYPKKNKVLVSGVNTVVKHRRPFAGQPGERVKIDKPITTAKIAVLNDAGQPDRIGSIVDKNGHKVRIFKKTGAVVPTQEKK